MKAVLGEPNSALPAAMVRPTNGRLVWLLDGPRPSLLPAVKVR